MPTPTDEFPWADLGRWFAGELSPAEAAELERWIAGDPGRAAVVGALRQAWISAGAAGEGWDAGAALRRVHDVSAAEARVIARLGETGAPTRGRRWSHVLHAARIAAVLALVTGGAFLAERASRRSEAPVPVTTAEYRTPRGQRLALRLADGTQVTLAPGSVLRRRSDYGQRERRLELEGEGYFIVTHDSTRPFTVHTRHMVARDLGTRFDVRAYSDEKVSEVLVVEGKVEVDTPQSDSLGSSGAGLSTRQAPVLGPGQLAQVNPRGELSVRSDVDLGRRLAWTEGRLVFKDTPLRDVRRQLERWYDVEIRLTGADLGGLRVSGEFEEEPVTQVLDAVARSLGLAVQSVAGGYELSRNPS